jgi:hypothetical protein
MVNFHGRRRCAEGIYAAFTIFTNDMGRYVLCCTSIAICFARGQRFPWEIEKRRSWTLISILLIVGRIGLIHVAKIELN